MRIENLRIPLEAITPSTQFRLLSVRPTYRYEVSQRTDEVIGYRYSVGDAATFEQFDIKVAGPALLQPEQLEAVKEPIDVEFVNCFIKVYRRNGGDYELSFSADAVRVVR